MKRGRSPGRPMDLHSAQNDPQYHHQQQQYDQQQYDQPDDDYVTDQRPSTTSEHSRGPSRGTSSGGHVTSASSGEPSRSRSQSRGGSVHSHRSPSPGSVMYNAKQPFFKALQGRPGSDEGAMDFGVNTEEWGANDFFSDQGHDDLPGLPIAEEATGEDLQLNLV